MDEGQPSNKVAILFQWYDGHNHGGLTANDVVIKVNNEIIEFEQVYFDDNQWGFIGYLPQDKMSGDAFNINLTLSKGDLGPSLSWATNFAFVNKDNVMFDEAMVRAEINSDKLPVSLYLSTRPQL